MTLVRVTSGLLYSPLSGRHVIANAPIVGYISREENILKNISRRCSQRSHYISYFYAKYFLLGVDVVREWKCSEPLTHFKVYLKKNRTQ